MIPNDMSIEHVDLPPKSSSVVFILPSFSWYLSCHSLKSIDLSFIQVPQKQDWNHNATGMSIQIGVPLYHQNHHQSYLFCKQVHSNVKMKLETKLNNCLNGARFHPDFQSYDISQQNGLYFIICHYMFIYSQESIHRCLLSGLLSCLLNNLLLQLSIA